ncbi:MAG: hypothetical protein V1772_04110, partial [Chloroflexota bacterium]
MHHPTVWLILAAPWTSAALIALVGQRRRNLPQVLALAGVSLAMAGLAAAALALRALDRGAPTALLVGGLWIGELDSHFSLRLDALALPFLANVLLVGLVALLYGWGY